MYLNHNYFKIFISLFFISESNEIYLNKAFAKSDFIYISNTALLNEDYSYYLNKFKEEKSLLFDMRYQNAAKDIMAKITGISLSGDFVILKKSVEGPKYLVISKDIEMKDFEDLILQFENDVKLVNLSTEEIVEKNLITVDIIRTGLKCELKSPTRENKWKDWCNSSSNVHLRYKIDATGSNFNNTDGVSTQSGKYLQITLEPGSSGLGWSLIDKLNIKDYGSQRVIGPFVTTYSFSTKYISNKIYGYYGVKLVLPEIISRFPENDNRDLQRSIADGKSHTRTIGFTSSLKGSVDLKGASGGADFGMNFSEASQTSHTYTLGFVGKEYIPRLNTNDPHGPEWHWESHMLNNREHQKTLYIRDLITPLAYSSFKPSLQTRFRVPINETGRSIFKVSTQIEFGMLNQHMEGAKLFVDKGLPLENTFSVYWDHPVFSLEKTFRLHQMNNSSHKITTKCLYDSNPYVFLGDCDSSKNMQWGYDNITRQFKNRAFYSADRIERCLSQLSNNTLGAMKCNEFDNNQKWILNNDKTLSLFADSNLIVGERGNKLFIIDKSSNNQNPLKLHAFPISFN